MRTMSEGLTHYKPTTKYLALACLGSLLIGVLMPTSLVWLHIYNRGVPKVFPQPFDTLSLFIAALIGCGPGAVILAAVAFGLLHKHRHSECAKQLDHGMLLGAILSFLNLPGYLS